jgi:hypothetical protein
VAWVGADLAPVGKLHTSNDLWQLVVAVKATPVFCAPSTSLNTMASAVLFDKHPFEGSSCVGRSRRCFRSDSTCVGVSNVRPGSLADAHHAGRFGETDHIGSVSRVRALVNPPYFQTETLPTLSMR